MGKFKIKFGKSLLVFVSLILILGGLIGCGSSGKQSPQNTGNNQNNTGQSGGSTEQVTIQFAGWGDPSEKEVFTKLIEAFEDLNPGIDVDYLHIPSGDYVGKMNTILAGGEAPDVFYVPDGDFGRWVSQDLLLPIDDYVNASNIDTGDMWDSALARYKFDGASTGQGALYALPKDIGPQVIFYNKDLFDKMNVPYPSADVPMTKEQLLETAQKLTVKEEGQFGMGPIWLENFVYTNGGKFLSDDKKEFVGNSPETIEALQFAADLVHKHGVVPSQALLQDMDDTTMFRTGKLAMIMQGRWMVPQFREFDFNWDVAPMPGKILGGISGSVGLSIYRDSKHVDAAYKLVEFLGGPEGQKQQSQMGFSIPSFKSMANTDVFLQPDQAPEHAKVFIDAAQNQLAGPWTILPNNKWFDMFNQGIAPIRSGEKSAADVLNELKPKIDAAIKEGNPALFQ